MLLINSNYADCKVVGFEENVNKLTIVSADSFKSQLYPIIDQGTKKIVIDMTRISFIDSSGFGAIVAVYNHAKNNHSEMVLCNISPMVQNLIKITKLDQVFDIYNSIEEAVNE